MVVVNSCRGSRVYSALLLLLSSPLLLGLQVVAEIWGRSCVPGVVVHMGFLVNGDLLCRASW